MRRRQRSQSDPSRLNSLRGPCASTEDALCAVDRVSAERLGLAANSAPDCRHSPKISNEPAALARSLSPHVPTGKAPMNKGTVKWFDSRKGFGFIQPEAGGKDVFVHISAVERAGLSALNEGQQASFDVVADRRTDKSAAHNLRAA